MPRTTCLAVLLATGLAAAAAHATTIDTFDFSQGDYAGSFGSAPFIGTLTGSFTGTVEANGLIELSDLSSIQVTFAGDPFSRCSATVQRHFSPTTPRAAPAASISPPGSASATSPASAPSRPSVPMAAVAAA
jgi:hypothetical protein